MRYRVSFTFRGQQNGHYFTEWFDSLEEAETFVEMSDRFGELFPMVIEDENGDVI